jgi:hypothetical protein
VSGWDVGFFMLSSWARNPTFHPIGSINYMPTVAGVKAGMTTRECKMILSNLVMTGGFPVDENSLSFSIIRLVLILYTFCLPKKVELVWMPAARRSYLVIVPRIHMLVLQTH